jgi:hypothetical protein
MKAWEVIQKYFEGNSIQREIMLKRKFYKLEMTGSNVEAHLSTAKSLYDQMKRMGIKIKE